MATLYVRLLGGLRVEHEGDVVDVGSSRAKAVLAYLLLHRGESVPRARLAALSWPDTHEAQARTNLRQTLHQLRRGLPHVDDFVVLDGQELRWRGGTQLELDVASFEEALARAERARAAAADELEIGALEAAVAWYTDDLLPAFDDGWLEPLRERLREACADALERLACLHARRQDHQAALRAARRLLRHEPLAEAGYRHLMRLHATMGERAAAVNAYHRCASTLSRELGVEPSPETRRLHEEIVRLDPPAVAERAGVGGGRAGGSAPLVGRRGELAALRVAWSRAAGGVASAVLLRGDAGIGKTRVATEFVLSLRRGEAAVAATRCHVAEGSLAYAPVAMLLRCDALRPRLAGLDPGSRRELSRLLPELHEPGSPPPRPMTDGWQRTRLFEALARLLLAAQPLVVVVDDVHGADRDTLEWLHYLLRRDPGARLLVVATARAHEVPANPALAALLPVLYDEGYLTEVDVPPLDEVATTTLVRAVAPPDVSTAAVESVVAASEGNPLFVIELAGSVEGSTASIADAWGDGVPGLTPKLHAVIAGRLARLTLSTIDLLRVAAVIGREFEVDTLIAVSRQDEDAVVRAVDEMWRRRVVRELGDGRYDFSHDLLREVAYGESSQARRQLLHRYVAETLEELRGSDGGAPSGRIARHYAAAGCAVRAVPHYLRAAEAAQRLFAEDEALGYYQRGLDLLTTLPPGAAPPTWCSRTGAQLHEGFGDVLARRGRPDAARERFACALALLPPGTDALERARLRRKVGLAWVARYRYTEGAAAFAAAEAELGEGGPDADTAWWQARIDLALARADMHYWQHRWGEIERELVRLRDAFATHGSPHQRGRGFSILAQMCFSRDRQTVSRACLELARSGHAAVRELGDPTADCEVEWELGFMCLWAGELDEAEQRLRRALVEVERIGDAVVRARIVAYLAFALRLRRDAAELPACAGEALRTAEALGMPEYVGAARGHLAWLAYRRGDLDACEREGLAALAAWTSGMAYPLQWSARLPLLACHLRRRRWREAAAEAQALVGADQQRLDDGLAAELTAAATAAAARDGTGARSHLKAAVAAAERTGRL